MKEVLFRYETESHQTVFHNDRSLITLSKDNHYDDEFYSKSKLGRFNHKHSSNTKETYIENYGNKLCSLVKTYSTIVIEKQENKISLKVFMGFRKRRAGVSWFTVGKYVDFLTVNKKYGDVYLGFLHDYQKKKKCKKKLSKNFFIEEPALIIMRKIRVCLTNLKEDEFKALTDNIMDVFMNELDNSNESKSLSYPERLTKYYMDRKGIKYPNNFSIFIRFIDKNFKKLLKKNNNKIVDTLMSMNELKGKKIKKAFHECSHVNFSLLKFAVNFFGEDWINQDDIIIHLLNTYTDYVSFEDDAKEYFTHEEKKKIYTLFKSAVINHDLGLYTFFDHIDLYVKLKRFGETDLKWTIKEYSDSFHREHMDWTDRLQYYVRGTYKRCYPGYFDKVLSEDINGYYPYLLTTSKDYNDESNVQSNCVKSYIGRVSSMIISLRKGGYDSDNRVTIEYRIEKQFDEISAHRVQTLGKFNQRICDELEKIICILDQKVLSLIKDDRFETFGIEKTCANGIHLYSESGFSENGKLFWTYNKVTNFV